jgi:hypothetical protein
MRGVSMRYVRGVMSIVALSMVVVSSAGAFEGKPLAIKRFAMEPTAYTKEIFLAEHFGGQKEYEFVNEPYRPQFTQADGHPWGLTTIGEFETEVGSKGSAATRDVKDIVVNLPPGLLGDPMAVPQCSLTQATSSTEQCPADTQVGVYRLHYFGGKQYVAPIVNVTPEAGQSAEFALENTVKAVSTPLLTAHLVRTSEDERYSIAVISKEIPVSGVEKFEVTFWGVPADSSHDAARGRICESANPANATVTCEGGGQRAGIEPVPFLTMPTDCAAGPELATMRADSWQEPGSVGLEGRYTGYLQVTSPFPSATSGVTGCDALQFKPGTGVGVEPDTELADEPVGLGVNLKVPLDEKPGTNATPLLRQTVLTLPEGMSVSPGVVDGIRACDATGPEGINIKGPESEFIGEDGEWHLAPGRCPDASKVGTAEAITPFLPVPVKGSVYLARPGCGNAALNQSPCTEQDALDGNLYRLYLELGGEGAFSNTGIEFKVPLENEVDPATGQITSVARELVQAPYSEVRIHLNGGPRSPIDNPGVCGPAVTTAGFSPWSAPGLIEAGPSRGLLAAGTPDQISSSYFNVTGCASPQPFNPGFVAGTVTPQAGQFSSFTLNLSRQDREQYVKGIQVRTPPGLLGVLSSVPLCGEPDADQGACPEASKIGTTRVASGAGSHPFELEGNIYLTGSYGGDPFGLSIVVPVVAGPFNLGKKVVRARIAVDPESSALTITTDETGPYAVPQIVFGVPVRLKRVTVNIDRPDFMFNPTNCSALQVTAQVSGSQEAVASVSSPFAAAGCRSLAFKPKFAASTSGRTSRSSGASLDTRLSYPAGSMGSEANIARVKVSLPRQLPSRLTTLQKACPAETFQRNPAACPRASVVGIARAFTPLLPALPQPRVRCATEKHCASAPPTSVVGPVYFVSHGGQAFPNLIVVLQGDGVRVDLVGDTFIDRKGITSTTFKTIPDVPVGTFELYLPQGKDSALAAHGSFCRAQSGLRMRTEFVAQNGAVFKQSTRIAVTGCGASKAKRARAKTRHGRSRK